MKFLNINLHTPLLYPLFLEGNYKRLKFLNIKLQDAQISPGGRNDKNMGFFQVLFNIAGLYNRYKLDIESQVFAGQGMVCV